MDKSLKQRLLGAAVLIALAIIFVPMFLSGSGPKPTSETANLQAPPSPDRRFQERTLSLDLPPPGANPSASGPSTDLPLGGERLATVDTATAPRPQPEPVIDVPASSEPAPAPAAATVATPKPAAASPTAISTAPPAAAPAPVATAPNLPGTAANGSYFVHLGDYGAGKNANDLVAALKKSGYSAFTEASQFAGKATTRVRVGPFADRAAAEATRLRISQSAVRAPATVVQNASDAKPAAVAAAPTAAPAPATSVPATAAPPAVAKAGGWAVQLGAFKTVDEANKLRTQLRDASFPAFVDKVVREGQTLWRVRVGPEAERRGADATKARIRDRLKLDGDVVSNP